MVDEVANGNRRPAGWLVNLGAGLLGLPWLAQVIYRKRWPAALAWLIVPSTLWMAGTLEPVYRPDAFLVQVLVNHPIRNGLIVYIVVWAWETLDAVLHHARFHGPATAAEEVTMNDPVATEAP